MRQYKPSEPFDVAMKLLTPSFEMVKGVRKTTYSDPENSALFFGSFRTYGGTENTSNGVYTIYDTAMIDTWFNPDISQDCHVYLCETGAEYAIISTPENIGMRHQYMHFKVQKVGGRP